MAETKTAIGKVSLTPRGAYNSSAAYERLDLVQHEGRGYVVLAKTIQGVTPVDGENYMLLADRGDGAGVDDTLTLAGRAADAKAVGDQLSSLSDGVDGLQKIVIGAETVESYTLVFNKTGSYDISKNFTGGESYHFDIVSWAAGEESYVACVVYLFRADDTYVMLPNASGGTNWHIGEGLDFVAEEDFVKIRFYTRVMNSSAQNITITENGTLTVNVYKKGGDSLSAKITSVSDRVTALETSKGINCLLLGDSYSALGQWVTALRSMVTIRNLTNLAVSNATLRDTQTDRTAFPYTSRPVSTVTTGNLNTAACQIEKLKRLMAGTDLDSGESAIYTSESDAPDFILVEFGKNDNTPDADTSVYQSQFWTTLTNVTAKNTEASASTINYYQKITDLEDTDRTTFAGAIRYVYSSLHELFPKALFLFVTASGLFYGSGQQRNYIEVSEQIEMACNFICQPVVRWDKVGRISYVDGNTIGSGTESDPYICRYASEYTLDALHPNEKGGAMLAMPVAKEIQAYLPYLEAI